MSLTATPFRLYALLVVLLAAWLPVAQAVDLPTPPQVAARAWLLMDTQSGQIVQGLAVDERVEPASLTKLMTAYVVFAALKEKRIALTQTVPVSERAWKASGSRMFIEPRKPVTVEELIHGMIIQSGNDACVALAELVAGSEELFAQLMNKEAQRLGMKNTSFMNSTGLPDPKHFTTARDLATLARALRRDFPQHYHYFSTAEFTYKGVSIANHNRVLNQLEGADGLKTGYIRVSGFNLATSATRNGRRIVGVVLGGESGNWRDARMVQLMEQAFDNTITNPAPSMIASAKPAPSVASSAAQANKTARNNAITVAEAAPGRAATLTDPNLTFEQGDTEMTVASLPASKPRYSLPKNSGPDWAIQVGAFSKQAPAHAAAATAKDKLPQILAAARVIVLDGREDGSKFFRARLTGLTEVAARTACKQLEQKGMGCITVAPEMGSSNRS